MNDLSKLDLRSICHMGVIRVQSQSPTDRQTNVLKHMQMFSSHHHNNFCKLFFCYFTKYNFNLKYKKFSYFRHFYPAVYPCLSVCPFSWVFVLVIPPKPNPCHLFYDTHSVSSFIIFLMKLGIHSLHYFSFSFDCHMNMSSKNMQALESKWHACNCKST